MPKRKRYEDLSRFQQWRCRQEIDFTITHTEIEIPQEGPIDNIVFEENNNYSNNNNNI